MPEKKGYFEITFRNIKKEDWDIVVALLSELEFDGFDESGDLLKAYVDWDKWNEAGVQQLAEQYRFTYEMKELPPQNWNAVWESNFEPVVIDDFVAVRAHFHLPAEGVEHEIVITPKMSFGTGHHATTTMMIG